jgi:hypothetical protein
MKTLTISFSAGDIRFHSLNFSSLCVARVDALPKLAGEGEVVGGGGGHLLCTTTVENITFMFILVPRSFYSVIKKDPLFTKLSETEGKIK